MLHRLLGDPPSHDPPATWGHVTPPEQPASSPLLAALAPAPAMVVPAGLATRSLSTPGCTMPDSEVESSENTICWIGKE